MTPVLARADLEQFRSVVERCFGLHYEDEKLDYLADVLRQRLACAHSRSFESYVAQLNAVPADSGEYRALAELLTVNETFFFRNADNFRALEKRVLPERIRARAHEKRLCILSAGCASGEEPYSLAIAVREALPDLAAWDVRIIGIDLSPAVIAKASQGRYSAWSLRATTDDARNRYFTAEGRDFVLHPQIRSMVRFEERNLITDDPSFWQTLDCDVVFCRNVLMYFTPDKARGVMRHLTQALLPGGFLFVGHAETLRGLSHEFHLCHTHDTFYYQRREASDPAPEPVTWFDSSRERAADPLPDAVESTASWVDAIARASERIANLTGQFNGFTAKHNSEHALAKDAAVPANGFDLALVLETMRQERFADALELIGALPVESQQDADALLLHAVLLTNNGKLAESEQVCNRLLALEELHAGAHYLMALCREHAGDIQGAIEHDRTAIYLDPTFAMPHLHAGLLAKRAHDKATAQRELGHALSLLAREDASRVLLFGGGFSREMLLQLCRAEIRAAGGDA